MSYADIAQFSLSILPILAIIFLAWKEYRSGSSRLRKDINEDYRERNSQLEEEIKKLREEVHKVNIQMMEFKATLIEKNKHIESLTKLVENRNPELIQILQELKKFLTTIQITSQKGLDTSIENQEELAYQTKIMDKQHKRDDNIDNASRNETGKPIRINN